MEPSHDVEIDDKPLDKDLSSPAFVEQTYHSIIETRQWKKTRVVVKTCRHQESPRTLPRWRDEVSVLTRLASHVRPS